MYFSELRSAVGTVTSQMFLTTHLVVIDSMFLGKDPARCVIRFLINPLNGCALFFCVDFQTKKESVVSIRTTYAYQI